MSDSLYYCGSELELFEKAVHWKQYVYNTIRPYIGDTVLEVGAGFGGSTKVFAQGRHSRWLCVEPDPGLSRQLAKKIKDQYLPRFCAVQTGTIADMPKKQKFDTILYIDVLEHIENDREEMENATDHLLPHGYLVVLCPAHSWLFSPFDKAIGHYRRYNKKMFKEITPQRLHWERLGYIDSVGLLASVANLCLLRQQEPTEAQITFWDRWMVPVSQRLDPMIGHIIGKSFLCVWKMRDIF